MGCLGVWAHPRCNYTALYPNDGLCWGRRAVDDDGDHPLNVVAVA
jgi:hypothetical protein